MINGKIYKITCIVNLKCYVGQTYHTVETRWNEHISGRGNKGVYNAIQEYGIEMFRFEVLHSNIPCRDMLNQLEIALIAAHDAYTQGYNEHRGGQDEYRYSEVWEHADEICRLYSANLKSMEQIAKQFNTDKVMIYRILRAKGVESRKRSYAWEHSQEICELYEKHKKSLQNIASVYGVTRRTIIKILKSNGIPIREARKPKGKLWEYSKEICELYTQHLLSFDKIAKRFKTSPIAIRRVLIGCGVELRKYSPRKSENTYQLLLDI